MRWTTVASFCLGLGATQGNKIGGCINADPMESQVPADPYTVSDIYTGTSCSPFSKVVRAYGLLLTASIPGQDVPDNALKWLSKATTELFPSSASDLPKQREVIENMYRYRAANPVFFGSFEDNMDPARDVLSMCDTITVGLIGSNRNGQFMEIYEHLLHIIADVGFSKTWPAKWGISTSSDLHSAMQEAITNGVYDVSSYAGIDDEARLRIQLQEFAYWAISTAQGVHATYFDGSAAPEWTLTTASQLETSAPLFWALHQATSATVLGNLSTSTITALQDLAVGQTPQDATWPIVDVGRGTLPTGAALTDPCSGAGSGGCDGGCIGGIIGGSFVPVLLFILWGTGALGVKPFTLTKKTGKSPADLSAIPSAQAA